MGSFLVLQSFTASMGLYEALWALPGPPWIYRGPQAAQHSLVEPLSIVNHRGMTTCTQVGPPRSQLLWSPKILSTALI